MSIIPGIETAAPERTETRSGSDGSPKRLPARSCEPADVLVDLRPELLGDLARAHRRAAGVRRDREPRRDGNAERGHLREPDALAAEELAAPGGLLVERVDQAHGAILRTGDNPPPVKRVRVVRLRTQREVDAFLRSVAARSATGTDA